MIGIRKSVPLFVCTVCLMYSRRWVVGREGLRCSLRVRELS